MNGVHMNDLADWVQVAAPEEVDDSAVFGSAFGAVARQLSESELLPDKFDEPPATSDAQRIDELEAKWSAMTAARAEATPAEARRAARPPSRRRWIAAVLALVVGMMAAEGGVRVHRSCVAARAARREAALRSERAALAAPKLGVAGALDAVGGWVREKGAMHAALSAGLGLAGLAIGVPCVPGVTDNLVIGAVGAVLPQLGWPLKAPDDEGE